MNTRNLIIIAILIVLAVIVGIFALTTLQDHGQNGKINTEIEFLGGDTFKSGETVEFLLKDADSNAIIGENITILFEENGENQTYSIVTDNDGKGGLTLNNEMPGTYKIYVSYNGSTRFEGCAASKTITIEEGYYQPSDSDSQESGSGEPIVTNSSAGTSLYNGNSTSSQNLHYDSQYNFYYDDNGIIRGGQNDGMSADYIREAYSSGNMVDEEGNLQ